ncbi:Glycerol-3-phosphate dehydrogenase, anaerobic, C subunit [uncultured delta proteobacterium]|uniref:Glycerol-3-phosphate dehydrogenase, anaerobic, C subunit n=1 Tax=uncultured delta proteobacterium TaxID=34034 RepID=A0A212IV86_9DELT|nr:Glycerol-3-phosphate dehydrogenase, anaerobic, C subunit [uncultured delta proteobacterium]
MKPNSFHTPDACTACTICVAHCPVAKATMNFRGPKLTGPAYERFRLLGFGDEASLEYCSNCKNCDISCPSGVPVATFNMLARAAYCKNNPQSLRDWLLAHSGDLGKLSAIAPAWALNFGMNNPISRFAMHAMGIEKRAPLPAFGPLGKRRELDAKRKTPVTEKTVAFFPGCFIRYYDPQMGLDLIRVLEMAGYTVVVPQEFECCGLPMVAGGYADDARDKARINTMELGRWARRGIPVLTACPSCALMLKHEYRDLFPDEDLEDHAPNVVDGCEFIMDLVRDGTLRPDGANVPDKRLAYHAPCHLRAQGTGRVGLDLLRMIPGLDVADMDAGCCGISGSYGFKTGKYEIGMAVGTDLFNAMKDSKATLSASECGTCRVQMRHGSGLAAAHPISILLRALGK